MKSQFTIRDLRSIVTGLEAQGARIRETREGWHIILPNGHGLALHRTVSDHRGFKNARALVLRSGIQWPMDPEFKKRKKD